MTHRPLLLVFLATALAAPLVIRAQQPAFRSAIDVVSMNVTVTDSTNRYVTDLAEKDFEVFEDGVKQELVLFNRSNLPVALGYRLFQAGDLPFALSQRVVEAGDLAVALGHGLVESCDLLVKGSNLPVALRALVEKYLKPIRMVIPQR